MSTHTLAEKPLPETSILLVGGPIFSVRVIEGAAKAVPVNSTHTKRTRNSAEFGERKRRWAGILPPRDLDRSPTARGQVSRFSERLSMKEFAGVLVIFCLLPKNQRQAVLAVPDHDHFAV